MDYNCEQAQRVPAAAVARAVHIDHVLTYMGPEAEAWRRELGAGEDLDDPDNVLLTIRILVSDGYSNEIAWAAIERANHLLMLIALMEHERGRGQCCYGSEYSGGYEIPSFAFSVAAAVPCCSDCGFDRDTFEREFVEAKRIDGLKGRLL